MSGATLLLVVSWLAGCDVDFFKVSGLLVVPAGCWCDLSSVEHAKCLFLLKRNRHLCHLSPQSPPDAPVSSVISRFTTFLSSCMYSLAWPLLFRVSGNAYLVDVNILCCYLSRFGCELSNDRRRPPEDSNGVFAQASAA